LLSISQQTDYWKLTKYGSVHRINVAL